MRDLNYQLKMLCRHSHEGSFETRVGRERQLTAIANQLHELGFRQLQATSLKQKHVRALVEHWQGQNLSPGTIKNRMSCLRWWAEKVNKRAVVAGSNDFYGIPDRQFVSDNSKAKGLAGVGALIPPGRSYIEQLRIYERHTANAGLSKMHGLRHAYAQHRYLELTGWPSPHGGGPSKKDLSPAQQQADQLARLAISRELGHVRDQITAVYLGR